MPTKAYRKFEQRVASFTEDLELCDLLTKKFKAQPDTQGNVSVALGSTAAAHPTLARRRDNRQSRNICGSHLKRTMHVAFIKDIHEDFSEFLTDTMRNAAQKGVDPVRFVGDVKLEIAARDILATGGWEAAVRLVSNAIFRKLENERSTKQLIQKIAVRLGLDLDQAILTDAMPYLDTRHMLVHQDAKADEAFIRDYPNIRLKNGRIDVNDAFVATARTNIKALANHVDDLMIAADLVRQQDLDGQR